MTDLHYIVPAALRERPQWVVWRYVVRDGKQAKMPIVAATGANADCTNADDWCSFLSAVDTWQQNSSFDGIGFVFSADDPYCGVDLDDCIDGNGIKDWAKEIIEGFNSYTEISPSGTGVKIFIKANKPGKRCRKKFNDGEVEIYDCDRFFAVTGNRIDSSDPDIHVRQSELDALYETVFGIETPASPSNNHTTVAIATLEDDQILQLAFRQKSGDKFRSLWEGKWNSHFNSASEADSSVVFTLAYYTSDAQQIDRMFRTSGLMRPKWDQMHGNETYGEATIRKAMESVTKRYTGKPPKRKKMRGIQVGCCDPKSNRMVLSVDRTLPTASAFMQSFYSHSEGATFYHFGGLFLEWRDGRFVEVEDGAIRNKMLHWLDGAVKETGEQFPANPRTVSAAIDSLKAIAHLDQTTPIPSWIRSNRVFEARDVVPCKSTIVHLPTMKVTPATPSLFTLNAVDYDPDLNAPPPSRWLEFLHEIFDGDTESWDLLQDWFGYCLTGDTSQQKMLLVVGPRRSGKGTIARVLTRLIGENNVCGPTTSSLAGPFGLQPMIGRSLAIVSDARFSGDGIQTVIERLLCVSGEDFITVDRKHQPSLSLKLPTRFMFLTNELPRLTDASGAIAGRFLMLRLKESFYGREDRCLTNRLLDEIPGIFTWAVEGWRRLTNRGRFSMPAEAEQYLQSMQEMANPIVSFIESRCDVAGDNLVRTNTLFEAYLNWCEEEGIKAASQATFGRALLAAVPGVRRARLSLGYTYCGIDLK